MVIIQRFCNSCKRRISEFESGKTWQEHNFYEDLMLGEKHYCEDCK